MEKRVNQTTIKLIEGDITRENVDAITNAANEKLAGGGGVGGAIHRAGGPKIMEECDKIRARQGGCPTGQAVITTGGNLPARYVIHTVGPIWRGGNSNEPALLASCYHESLALAHRHGLGTIAFPSISTGVYGYPTPKAAAVALNTVNEFVSAHQGIEEVRFVLFDDAAYQYFKDALSSLDS